MAEIHTAAIRLFRSLSMSSCVAADHKPKVLSSANDFVAQELSRRSSDSSISSNSSSSSTDTELQPWNYISTRKQNREQNEVRRTSEELRQRNADAAWREFWG